MRNLLERIQIIDDRYQQLNDKDEFNIFTLLRKDSDEVYLHSRFIGELLNPNGTHNLADTFLHLFTHILAKRAYEHGRTDTYMPIHVDKARVDIEFSDNAGTDNNRIDLLVRNHHCCIVIENKIHAEDQYRQLSRYYEYARRSYTEEQTYIVYLSLYGKSASKESMENRQNAIHKLEEKNVINLSYQDDICEWLEACIKEAASHPTLRETLQQYLLLVKKLTEQTMSAEKMKELVNLLSEPGNAHKAYEITKVWDALKINTISCFWNELEQKIANTLPQLELLNIQKYSDTAIKDAVRKSGKNNAWFGLMYSIQCIDKTNNIDACLYIEMTNGELRYGIILIKDKNQKKYTRVDCSTPQYSGIRNELKKIPDINEEPYKWLGFKNLTTKSLWLTDFNNTDTLDLAEKHSRDETLNLLTDELKSFTTQVSSILDNNKLA